MDTLTSVQVGSRGNKGACFFPTLVLPVIKVTYVSSCSFVVPYISRSYVCSERQKARTLSENVANGKINVNADLFISFFLNTPFHTAVLLRKKRRGYRGTTPLCCQNKSTTEENKLGAISRTERLRGFRAGIVRQLGIEINLLLVYY